jgi:hypothetical protein
MTAEYNKTKYKHAHTQAVSGASCVDTPMQHVLSQCELPGGQTTLNLPCKCAHLFATAFPLCSPLELCFIYLKKFGEEAEGLRRGGGAGAEG